MAAASHPTRLNAEINIISAKHLKNVNWRDGDLKPYAVLHLDADHYHVTTKIDDSGSTRPVWNERFTLPLPGPIQESVLTVEIFHYKPSDTPKPLVGTAWTDLTSVIHPTSPIGGPASLKTLDLSRPSGRLHGKVQIMISLRERLSPSLPDFCTPPPFGLYPFTAPSSVPPPPLAGTYGCLNQPSLPLSPHSLNQPSPPLSPPSLNQPPPPLSPPPPFFSYPPPPFRCFNSARYLPFPPLPVMPSLFIDRAPGYRAHDVGGCDARCPFCVFSRGDFD